MATPETKAIYQWEELRELTYGTDVDLEVRSEGFVIRDGMRESATYPTLDALEKNLINYLTGVTL